MKFVRLVKGKLFVAVLAGVVLIGGATIEWDDEQPGIDK